MMDKRLLALVPGAMKHVLATVGWQWLGLAGNVALVWGICNLLAALVTGSELPVATAAALAAVGIAARMASTRLAARSSFAASQDVKQVLRRKIYEKLLRLGPGYSDQVSTAEVVQLSVEGCEQLETYFGQYLPQLFYSVLAPVTLFAIVAPICLPASVVLLVCVPLIPMTIVAVQKIAKRILSKYWDQYAELGDSFLENLQGLTTLKIYGADAARHEAQNREAEHFREVTMAVLSMQLNSIIVMDIVALGGAVAGIAVAAFAAASGAVDLWGALFIVLVSADFFLPMRQLGSYFHVAMNGMAAADKIFKLLELPEPPAREARPVAGDSYALRHVDFSYEADRQVLSDVSIDVPAVGLTAIVGESGSGKSTVAALLAGRYGSYQGSVALGGHEVRDLDPSALAAYVTTVGIGAHLFAGTVRQNLLMAAPDAAEKDLWDALEFANLAEFVREEDGLDLELVEGAANLSGGQRQRLALARAVLAASPVYVFDEATSNIDVESEEAIMAAVRALASTRSVVVISHRLANVVDAGRIYVLDGGCVAGEGTHEELLSRCDVYRRLWEAQSELEAFARGEKVKPEIFRFAQDDKSAQDDKQACHSEERGDEESRVSSVGVETQSQNNFALMRRMLGLAKPLAGIMVVAIACGVAGFCCATGIPVLGAKLMLVATGADSLSLGGTVAILALMAVARGVLHYVEQRCNHYIAFKLLAHIRDLVFGALRRLAPAKLAGSNKGELISTVTSDVELLEVFYAHTISPVCIAVLMAVVMAAFLGGIHPALAVLALVAYVLVGVVVPVVVSRASGTSGQQSRDLAGSLSGFVLDGLRGLGQVLQFGAGEKRLEELDRRSAELVDAQRDLRRVGARGQAAAAGLIVVLSCAELALSVGLAASGAITPEGAVLATVAMFSSFGPFVALANLGSTLQNTLASGRRVLAILDEEPLVPEIADEDGAHPDFTGIAAEHVGFAYDGERILDDVSLRVAPGQIVGVSGPSGSGKSTLCRLLMRFWDVDEGRVALGGEDVRHVATSALRASEAFVEQDTCLFHDSIAANLRIAKADATQEELEAACRAASIHDFIASLPHGYDTMVGELGDSLSGGERQRLGLARAFLHDAPLLLLDEPTSNLDSLNEGAILKALDAQRGRRAVLIISHRPSTMAIADEVYRMEGADSRAS